MLKNFLLATLILITASSEILGQKCGRGYFAIKIPGSEVVEYKLLYLQGRNSSEYTILETLLPANKLKSLSIHQPLQIENKAGEIFLKSYKAKDFFSLPSIRWSVMLYGSSQDGSIGFQTSEGDDNYYLLKLSTEKNKTAFFVGNYLGGC